MWFLFDVSNRLEPSIPDDSLDGWRYLSALAYNMDANWRRSSTAAATNDGFCGFAAGTSVRAPLVGSGVVFRLTP